MLVSRRTLLKASAVVAGSGLIGGLAARIGAAATAPDVLEARFADASIAADSVTKKIMTYSQDGMPPVLRAQKGKPFAMRLLNSLDEPTTVHWHGVRVPNAMDGVPELTQPYVYSGDTFDYAFTPPDAGTFWYHPHCNTLTQMGRGMTGLLVVENPADPVFDADIPINLRDWRLGKAGEFIAPFKPRDAARTGTYGTVRTANWQREPRYDAPTGGLVRLRLAATDVTRIYTLNMEGADSRIVAIDGNPIPAPFAVDHYDFGPGQRLDVVVRMPDVEGATVTLSNARGNNPWVIATLRSVGPSLKRDLRDVKALEPNPVAEADLTNATEIPLELTATAENTASPSICGSIGYTFWAINRIPWPGDTPDPIAPLAEMKLGKSYIFNLSNRTPHTHPIHLHGMSFRVLNSNKRAVLSHVTDTMLLLPDEQVQVALVADNPGDWVMHCHIIEHQKTGMTAYVRVV